MHNPLDLFNYHIHWKSTGHHPGQHKSGQRGMGIEFTGHSNLLDYPDPRRIDIRQTIRDPLEQVHVRIFNQECNSGYDYGRPIFKHGVRS